MVGRETDSPKLSSGPEGTKENHGARPPALVALEGKAGLELSLYWAQRLLRDWVFSSMLSKVGMGPGF